jgi:hypothetical protein
MKAVRTRGYEVAYTKEAIEEAASLGPKKLLGLFPATEKLQNFSVFFPIVLYTPCSMLYVFHNPKSQIRNL